jgi:hypothetical protein
MNQKWLGVSLLAVLIGISQAFVYGRMPFRPPTTRKMTTQDPTALTERTKAMEARAKDGIPFVDSELDEVIRSLRNITPDDSTIDFDVLRKTLSAIAHLSHKDWTRTGDNAEVLGKLLLPDGMSDEARSMLERIINEGRWDTAAKHASEVTGSQPWAVLVTGVNGIRKTTSMYQPWFPELLAEALVAPPGKPTSFDPNILPTGTNGFFRQLDHMIAVLCNEDFAQLYSLTGEEMKGKEEPPKELIQKYSNLKAAIFTRYRTLAELLGVLLLREAHKCNSNCMMETSGRDVAMFHYVDHFFPGRYNKLALHFTINDLGFAQKSVDTRMVDEMKSGIEAVQAGDVRRMMYANVGGPYGSEVLPGVQEDSDRVWNNVVLKNDGVGQDWYKATIAINAHPTEPWTAQAVRPNGSLGKVFSFELRNNKAGRKRTRDE